MKTFNDIYEIVQETSSGEEAFNRGECEAMYNILTRMPRMSNIVELGVQFGRSTTLLGLVAKEKDHTIVAVDNWKEDVSPQAKANIEKQIAKHSLPVDIWSMDSVRAASEYMGDVGFIHLDADHTYLGLLADCVGWLPKVQIGGYACFDDYGHDSLPGVMKAVTEYMENHPGWEFVSRYGHKLGVFRKKGI